MTTMAKLFCLIILPFAWITALNAAPANKIGPCVGMDCLHGMLMHGDSESGQDHKDEDHKKAENKQPTAEKEIGAESPNEFMHGTLMHADNKPGRSHASEDEREHAKATKDSSGNIPKGEGVEDPHEQIHKHEQEIRDDAAQEAKKANSNVVGRWLQSAWGKLTGNDGDDDLIEIGTVHDIMDDLKAVGSTAPDSELHLHHGNHPRMEKSDHINNAHAEN